MHAMQSMVLHFVKKHRQPMVLEFVIKITGRETYSPWFLILLSNKDSPWFLNLL